MALNVRATLNLDGRGFATGLQRAQQGLVSFGQKLAGIFVTGYIASAIRRIGKELADIPDKAAGMGLTTDQFQALDFAAKQTGTQIESVVKATLFLARAQKEALTGNDKMAASFDRIGFSLDDVRSNTPQDLFKQIGAGVESGRIGLQNMADLMAVLGRNFQEYFKFLAQGGASTAQQFIDNNRAITEDTLNSLDDIEDRWVDLKTTMLGAGVEAAEGLFGMLKKGMNNLKVTIAGVLHGNEMAKLLRADLELEGIADENRRGNRRERRKRAAGLIREATLLELQDMQPPEKEAKEKARAKIQVASDALSKIGGFTGLGGARSAEASLRKIEKNTDKTAMASKRLADALGNGL